jgi:hypothetical protein
MPTETPEEPAERRRVAEEERVTKQRNKKIQTALNQLAAEETNRRDAMVRAAERHWAMFHADCANAATRLARRTASFRMERTMRDDVSKAFFNSPPPETDPNSQSTASVTAQPASTPRMWIPGRGAEDPLAQTSPAAYRSVKPRVTPTNVPLRRDASVARGGARTVVKPLFAFTPPSKPAETPVSPSDNLSFTSKSAALSPPNKSSTPSASRGSGAVRSSTPILNAVRINNAFLQRRDCTTGSFSGSLEDDEIKTEYDALVQEALRKNCATPSKRTSTPQRSHHRQTASPMKERHTDPASASPTRGRQHLSHTLSSAAIRRRAEPQSSPPPAAEAVD